MKTDMRTMMKKTVCLMLAVLMLALTLVACGESVKDPVLEYKDHKISLSMYEFLLSRMKGTLARNKYDVRPSSPFWTEIHPGTELTNEEYYNAAILDNCKNYLAALVIFDEEGLVLSESAISDIDEEIAFYIDYDGEGSEEKLDLILAEYGTNTEGLRKIYETEAKYQAVISFLYGLDASLIASNVKEEYYRANYYRFKQILISNFYYEYIKDEDGNIIYFDPEDGLPLYDQSGSFKYDENGERISDGYGVDIRYGEDGERLYDKEIGLPSPTVDEDGKVIKHFYSDGEMSERAEEIDSILNACDRGNFSAFEAEIAKHAVYEGSGEHYTDGYYLSDIESGGYDEYMLDILSALKGMDVGDMEVVESESGYHIIMKYELDSGKFDDGNYAEWFTSFDQSLIDRLFLDRCADFYDDIMIVEDELAMAKSIKNVGRNFDY